MNPDVKKLWIDDLNDENIIQGTGQLRDINDRFCCLGVLCRIAVREGIIPDPKLKFSDPEVQGWALRQEENYYIYGTVNDTSGFSLPYEVIEWADLDESDPQVILTEEEAREFFGKSPEEMGWSESHCAPSMAGMNDEGIPFSVIARVIDRKL
jgi:hypothetical protein